MTTIVPPRPPTTKLASQKTAVSPEFGDFQSADSSWPSSSTTGAEQSSLPREDPLLDKDTLRLPSLSELLSDEQKIAFCTLCWLTFTELKNRYFKFEFMDPQPSHAKKTLSGQITSYAAEPPSSSDAAANRSTLFSSVSAGRKSKRREEASRLLNHDDDDDEDMDVVNPMIPGGNAPAISLDTARNASTPLEPISTSQSFRGSIESLIQDNSKRKPFGDLMDIPETIEDLVFLGKTIDGNVALCYAIRTYDLWAHRIMDRLYLELKVTAQGIRIQ